MGTNPTNADIIREVREVKETVTEHDKLIKEVYKWMVERIAVEKYQERFTGNGKGSTLNKEFVSVVLKFLTVLSAILGIVYLLVKEVVG